MICQDFDQVFYPILNAVRISQDFDQLSKCALQLQEESQKESLANGLQNINDCKDLSR